MGTFGFLNASLHFFGVQLSGLVNCTKFHKCCLSDQAPTLLSFKTACPTTGSPNLPPFLFHGVAFEYPLTDELMEQLTDDELTMTVDATMESRYGFYLLHDLLYPQLY